MKGFDFAKAGQARHFQQVAYFRLARAVKHRRGEGNTFLEAFGVLDQVVVFELRERFPDRGLAKHFLEPAAQRFGFDFPAEQALQAVAEFLGSPAEVRLENLSDVHTRRNAEGIENDLDRGAIGQVRHIFLRHDARDDAFVAVAAGHFVADGQLALHGAVDFDQLDDAGRQFVGLLELFLALFGDLAKHVNLARGHLLDFFDFLDKERSEEHTSELQSQSNLVCRLLLEKKNKGESKYKRRLKNASHRRRVLRAGLGTNARVAVEKNHA